MNKTSRTITGISMIVLGLVLIVVGFFTMFVTWFYGIPILILGIFIYLNKNEDAIEERKDKLNKSGGKK